MRSRLGVRAFITAVLSGNKVAKTEFAVIPDYDPESSGSCEPGLQQRSRIVVRDDEILSGSQRPSMVFLP